MQVSPVSSFIHNKASKAILNKELIMPALAVSALFYEANRQAEEENEHRAIVYIGTVLTKVIAGIYLQAVKAFYPVAAAYTAINAMFKKSTHNKVGSVIEDATWIGCGLAAQKLFTSNFMSKGSTANNIRKFGFLANMSAFAVGSLLVAPFVRKFISKNIYDLDRPDMTKEEEEKLRKKAGKLALPISMDRTGAIGKVILPDDYRVPENAVPQK